MKLTIRMHTESLHVTVLIEFRSITSIMRDINQGTVVQPKIWKSASGIAFIDDAEILILVNTPRSIFGFFPDTIVFFKIERSGGVQMTGDRKQMSEANKGNS